MAAALSYRTLFALIPVLLVGLVGLAAFSTPETQRDTLRQFLHFAGLDRIALPAESGVGGWPPGVEMGPPAPPGVESAQNASEPAKTVERLSLDGWIESQVSRLRGVSFATLGIIGILFLVYAAVSMVVEIETTFNQIYSAPEGRSWLRRILQYWTLLTLGPLLLILSFSVTARATSVAEDLASRVQIPVVLGNDDEAGESAEGAPASGATDAIRRPSEATQAVRYWTPRVIGFVGTTAISTLFFLVIYISVPNTRVQVMPALWGAATAAILWESGKWGFAEYVRYATDPARGGSYSQFYGAVAILPLGMLWIYFTWVIVLTGLQLAYSMQTYTQATARGLTESVLATLGLIDEPRARHRMRLVDPSAMVGVAACVAQRFAMGKTSDHCDVADATGVDETAVGEMLEKLAGAGILLRVGESDTLQSYTPAKPPERISAIEVLRLGDELQAETGGCLKGTPVAEALTRARAEALSGKSLADFIEMGQAAPVASSVTAQVAAVAVDGTNGASVPAIVSA
jgi:membrane protein